MGLGVLAACDDSATTPDAAEDQALMLLADQAFADAESDMSQARRPGMPGLRFRGFIPGAGSDDGLDCPVENGSFVCTREHEGATMTARITYFDEAGATQAGYDAELTASVHIVSSVEGSRESGRFSGTASRNRDMTVIGLLGDETQQVWNGTTAGASTRTHLQGEFAGESISSTSTSTISDLTLLPRKRGDSDGMGRGIGRRGGPPPFPLAGTVTTELTVDGGPRAGDHLVVVTFDGTQYATVTIDGETMTVDLAKRGRRGHGMKKGRG